MTHSPRPYPRSCTECRRKTVNRAFISHAAEVKYDGVVHALQIASLPVSRCENCGAVTFGVESEAVIDHALRDHLALLHPSEIRAARESLGLTQPELAAQIGCAPESLCRWERGGVIQSRLYDRMLRAYFHLPQLREFFVALSADATLGRIAIPATLPQWSYHAPLASQWFQVWNALSTTLAIEFATVPQPAPRYRAEPHLLTVTNPCPASTPESAKSLAA